MSSSSIDKEKFNILPYDFVKENQIIVSQKTHGYEVISPTKLHQLFIMNYINF